jgi:hypothetical protein
MPSNYNEHLQMYGCHSRQEYFEMLADEYGVDVEVVETLADALGPNEDFDGLPSILEDM